MYVHIITLKLYLLITVSSILMMERNYVDIYVSDDESINELNEMKKRRSKRNRCWYKCATYTCKEDAENSVKAEETWSFHYKNKTNDGHKAYYRCSKVKRRGLQCNAGLYLLYWFNNTNVAVFKTYELHSHEGLHTETIRLSDDIKNKIKQLFDLHIKPKKMLEILTEQGKEFQISKSQLSNYLVKLREQTYGPSKISLGELEQWCLEHSKIPVNDDTSYVVSFYIKHTDDEKEGNEKDEEGSARFGVFISTNRLLKHSKIRNNIHIDATYNY